MALKTNSTALLAIVANIHKQPDPRNNRLSP
jgi:hypothetical protein